MWLHALFVYIGYILSLSIVNCASKADVIGTNSSESDLFVIPNLELTYIQAQNYCDTYYHGLANIYDPNENNFVLQLVNLNFITHAFIGYIKDGSDWKWESNVSSNPLLWID